MGGTVGGVEEILLWWRKWRWRKTKKKKEEKEEVCIAEGVWPGGKGERGGSNITLLMKGEKVEKEKREEEEENEDACIFSRRCLAG